MPVCWVQALCLWLCAGFRLLPAACLSPDAPEWWLAWGTWCPAALWPAPRLPACGGSEPPTTTQNKVTIITGIIPFHQHPVCVGSEPPTTTQNKVTIITGMIPFHQHRGCQHVEVLSHLRDSQTSHTDKTVKLGQQSDKTVRQMRQIRQSGKTKKIA